MNDTDRAFPVFDNARKDTDYGCFDYGMTLRQYAAIKLRVPRSGDPELDAMIRESRRADFAGQAMAGLFWRGHKNMFLGDLVEKAYEAADATLAEWEKKETP
jgi:hypothetical protein